MTRDDRPAFEGFFLPPEWAVHARTWMQWPTPRDYWGERLPQAYVAYARVARAVAQFEPVVMVARPEDMSQAKLACGRDIELLTLNIDDAFVRECGPVFVTDGRGEVAGVHWRYNACGERRMSYGNDRQFGARLLDRLNMRCYSGPLVLEGSALCADGAGSLLALEPMVASDSRNPMLSVREIEEALALYLGVRRIFWLAGAYEGDSANGHVTRVAAFAGTRRLLVNMPQDISDPHYPQMRENLDRLRAIRDGAGNPYEVIEVPQPARRLGPDGSRLSLSYLDFYLVNGGVIVPLFEDRLDGEAAEIISNAFADRGIVQVDAREFAEIGVGLRSVVLDQPEGAIVPSNRRDA